MRYIDVVVEKLDELIVIGARSEYWVAHFKFARSGALI